jgi:hypothetical protein
VYLSAGIVSMYASQYPFALMRTIQQMFSRLASDDDEQPRGSTMTQPLLPIPAPSPVVPITTVAGCRTRYARLRR